MSGGRTEYEVHYPLLVFSTLVTLLLAALDAVWHAGVGNVYPRPAAVAQSDIPVWLATVEVY